LHRQQAEPEVGDLLRRLASDRRMKKVWNELRRRKRASYQPTESFIHSPTPMVNWTPDARYALQQPEQLRQGGPPAEFLAAYYAVVLQASYQGQGPSLPLQDLAMVYFFDQVFTLRQQNIRLVPISELRK